MGVSLVSSIVALNVAHAAQLTQWTFDSSTHWLTLHIPGGTTPQYFLLAQPPRIVVDLPNTQVDNVNVPEVTTYSGMVQSVRVGQFQPELTRIVIEFDPDITFAPGHIAIQPGGSTQPSEHGNREVVSAETWYIRPLLVGQEEANSLPPDPVSAPSAISESRFSEPISALITEDVLDAQGGESSSRPTALNAAPVRNSLDDQPLPSQDRAQGPQSEDLASRNLPPLEPGALEIPVDMPNAPLPTASRSPAGISGESEEQASIALASEHQSSEVPNAPEPGSVDRENHAFASTPQDDAQREVMQSPLTPLPAPETAFLTPPNPESSPDLPLSRSALQDSSATSVPIITFGQTFSPTSNRQLANPQTREAIASEAAQNTLSVRYPREMPLPINPESPRQEVLVVTEAVRDRAGMVVIPEGSLVIGRFEKIGQQLQFTAQALTLGDRTIRLESSPVALSGDTIEPNQQFQLPLDPSTLGPRR